jgi:hypothetical protein
MGMEKTADADTSTAPAVGRFRRRLAGCVDGCAAILTIATGSGGVAIVVGTSGYAGTKVAE